MKKKEKKTFEERKAVAEMTCAFALVGLTSAMKKKKGLGGKGNPFYFNWTQLETFKNH